MDKTTTITIKESTWTELNMRRALGQSMDDVIKSLIGDSQ